MVNSIFRHGIRLNLAEHRLRPLILVNGSYTKRQLGQFIDLCLLQSGRLTYQLAVFFVRQAQDDFRVGVAYDRHIQQAGSLIRNDKTLTVSTHLRNGVGQHLHRLALQICPFLRLFRRRLTQQIVRLFQHGNMAQSAVHLAATHPVFLQLHDQNAHQQRFCLHRPHPAQVHDHIAVKQLCVAQRVLCAEHTAVNAVGQRLHTGTQSAHIIALGVLGVVRFLNDARQNIQQVEEGRENPLLTFRIA